MRAITPREMKIIDMNAAYLGVSLKTLMETTGEQIFEAISERMPLKGKSFGVFCGPGNNGGDGYAVARHLANNGCNVSILQLSKPKTSDAKVNASIVKKMGIPISPWTSDYLNSATLIIDAIFGTGLDRNVEGDYSEIIRSINSSPSMRIALDIPSGLDCDTGLPLGCSIEADMTISFVGIKRGFHNKSAKRFIGEINITDIGCPFDLLIKYGSAAT